jgi:hypothetical protein
MEHASSARERDARRRVSASRAGKRMGDQSARLTARLLHLAHGSRRQLRYVCLGSATFDAGGRSRQRKAISRRGTEASTPSDRRGRMSLPKRARKQTYRPSWPAMSSTMPSPRMRRPWLSMRTIPSPPVSCSSSRISFRLRPSAEPSGSAEAGWSSAREPQ